MIRKLRLAFAIDQMDSAGSWFSSRRIKNRKAYFPRIGTRTSNVLIRAVRTRKCENNDPNRDFQGLVHIHFSFNEAVLAQRFNAFDVAAMLGPPQASSALVVFSDHKR